jgi:hypothetical protein
VKRGSPAFPEETALPAVGRASRAESPPDGEIWRLPPADDAVARRLLQLGEAGLGGFVDGGIDDAGVWLLRRAGGTSLHEALRARRGAWPFAEAVGVARSIARALAACEKAALFPGPLTPEAIVIEGGAARLPATALVGALVGAGEGAARTSGTASPMWIPPAQQDGAPWDAAANRYALGLVLYRLLAGEHPFAGAGLRHAMEAAHRAPPPFKESVASGLPAGLQSLTLRMLDPDAGQRPGSAAAIAEDLAGFLEPSRASSPDRPRLSSSSSSSGGASSSSRSGSRARSEATIDHEREREHEREDERRTAKTRTKTKDGGDSVDVIQRYWPVLAGAAVALACVALLAKAPSAPPATVAAAPLVPPAAPLTPARTTAADCAACHPRQAAEWRRSVMAHSVKSPLFNALESLIEEQVGRDQDCPNGAGVLRRASAASACRDPGSNNAITGSGGEHWCVNCHSPVEKLDTALPPWEGRSGGDARSRLPVRDLLGERGMEGISCGFCHEVHGPVPARGAARGGYEGNATWTSFVTGATFAARPEDGRGLTGIGNSGYDLRPQDFVARAGSADLEGGAHLRAQRAATSYLRSSEFCGSCHDVRLFGTDTLGVARGEHFKRLRNAYSEWAAWAAGEARAGRTAATCQDCHMSAFPGVCEADAGGPGGAGCPPGFRFASRAPGSFPEARAATSSAATATVTTHYFSGVDVPLSHEYPAELVDEPTLDLAGIPLSARGRRDMLLRRAFRFGLGAARATGPRLEIPVEIENVGAGHRVPAGFSQEREIWVHLVVRDARGGVVYEVGRVDRGDEDLHDKVFARVNVRGDDRDGKGRPLGLFGADVRDGPDVPLWQPPPVLGGTSFRGKGLVNFQNGFLRCVRCIGAVGADGRCEAGPGQGDDRAARFADGDYDLDTGACRSNLTGMNALFETYFPVGALDASRGLAKGPDAIVDTRSAPPGVPIRYTYDLDAGGRRGPFKVEARLLFRAFPPFLVKAFAAYEREQARRGLRPSGPLVTEDMLARLEVVEIARAEAEIR